MNRTAKCRFFRLCLGLCPLHTSPVLAEHGIDKFVIKPVRRNYAFELDSVPHGEQWVLKVRYSAAKPSLPNGLEGTRPMHPVLLPCQKAHLLAWIW